MVQDFGMDVTMTIPHKPPWSLWKICSHLTSSIPTTLTHAFETAHKWYGLVPFHVHLLNHSNASCPCPSLKCHRVKTFQKSMRAYCEKHYKHYSCSWIWHTIQLGLYPPRQGPSLLKYSQNNLNSINMKILENQVWKYVKPIWHWI